MKSIEEIIRREREAARVAADTGMGIIQAQRHVAQRDLLRKQYAADLKARAAAAVAAYAERGAL